jgi:hypothetical protein
MKMVVRKLPPSPCKKVKWTVQTIQNGFPSFQYFDWNNNDFDLEAIMTTCHGCSKAEFSQELEDQATRKIIVPTHMGGIIFHI